jgi:hypothetical protein
MTMDNSEKYRFADFIMQNYRKMVQAAKQQGFQFKFYNDTFSSEKRQVIWRHDVEFSPFIALEMAEIERDEGIKATYFFQLHGEFYNVLEKEVSDIVYKIKALGHDIGLHFDSHYFDIDNEENLEKYLDMDTRYFNAIFNTDIKAFSFHNTNPFVLACEKEQYAGLINVYSAYFKEHFAYCSDSTGFWRYESLIDVLNNTIVQKLHVLTHDAMWSSEILSPRQRVFTSVDENALRIKQWYDTTLSKFGAKNVDCNEVYE